MPIGRAGRLSFAYFLHFLAAGITLPYLPAYFEGLGLSGTQIGVLLALQPAFSLFVPTLFARRAERSGRTDLVYTVLLAGAIAGFAPLLGAGTFLSIAASVFVYAFFISGHTTMLDTMCLTHVAKEGGSYSRLRLFGSLGFVVSSALYGWSVREVGLSAVFLPLLVMGVSFFWSLTLHESSTRLKEAPKRSPLKIDRELGLLLAASAVHWIAGAPFNGMFALHVKGLGLSPGIVGTVASLGVFAEVGFMLVYPKLEARYTPRTILAFTFALSALRWAFMSVVHSGPLLIATGLLHAFSFGAFFVATISAIARRVPPELRASGQALFVSATFGVGGLGGFLLAGRGYDLFGGSRLFAIAALLELVPLVLVLLLRPVRRER